MKPLRNALSRLATASIDPTYLFFILTDLVWGASVVWGQGFHENVPDYSLINSDPIGWLMIALGVIGLINFFYCKRLVIGVHTMFNMAFYSFITLIQFRLHDGAFARNGVIVLLAMWVMYRLQSDWQRARLLSSPSFRELS